MSITLPLTITTIGNIENQDDNINQELEEQLFIFPEKKGIKELGSVIHLTQQV